MQADGGNTEGALSLDALLAQIASELERVHAHLAGGPLRLGPVEVVLRGGVSTDATGASFRTGGEGEVRAYFVGVEPPGLAPVTPELLGLTRSAAARRARAAGAGLVVTVVPCVSAELAGRVCWQRPEAGAPQVSGRIAIGVYSVGR
ncbi:hypothetical protein [Archangium violaceum]|uniref:PASTA domain-containing protein n=1 Tax=Archangium violaceum Cb vi76 TaxID=1406225 RepID=A0A084SSR4_9BACT|nr:hypothetical protein [Archangium violaceum]KFA91499.1 hypothetical protein Q664_22105 [Archangium violaceum Cb vi76]